TLKSLRFPYTTLFRSERRAILERLPRERNIEGIQAEEVPVLAIGRARADVARLAGAVGPHRRARAFRDPTAERRDVPYHPVIERSEEHTSELQSPDPV